MSKALAHADIVRRMKDYFARQMAWFEQMHDAFAEFDGEIDPDHLDRLLEADSARARISKELEEEFAVLKSEWDRTDSIPESAADEVRAIARQAEERAEELQQAVDQAARKTGKGVDELHERLGALRKGRQLLAKYRWPGTDDAGLMDHQA